MSRPGGLGIDTRRTGGVPLLTLLTCHPQMANSQSQAGIPCAPRVDPVQVIDTLCLGLTGPNPEGDADCQTAATSYDDCLRRLSNCLLV
jgi:hypothetical protein